MNVSNSPSPGALTLVRVPRPQANAVSIVVSRHELRFGAGVGAGAGDSELQPSMYLIRTRPAQLGIALPTRVPTVPAWHSRHDPRRRPRRCNPVNRHVLSALAAGVLIVCLVGAGAAATGIVRSHESRRARELAALEARRVAETRAAAEHRARVERDAGIERALEQHRVERAGAEATLLLVQQNLQQLEQKLHAIEAQRQPLDPADAAMQELCRLARARAAEGKLDQAIDACKQVVQVWATAHPEQAPRARDTLEHVAESCFALGRYDDGILLLEHALGAGEDDGRTTDARPEQPIDPLDWSDWRLLARLYVQQRRYADAEQIYLRLVGSRERVAGRDDPLLADDAAELGELYERQGRAGEAEALYKLSMQIREHSLGPFHPDVARSALRLADLYRIRGHSAEADALYDLARDIRQHEAQN